MRGNHGISYIHLVTLSSKCDCGTQASNAGAHDGDFEGVRIFADEGTRIHAIRALGLTVDQHNVNVVFLVMSMKSCGI